MKELKMKMMKVGAQRMPDMPEFEHLELEIATEQSNQKGKPENDLRHRQATRSLDSRTRTLERVVTSVFVLGNFPDYEGKGNIATQNKKKQLNLPKISSHATIGRNSQFYNLTNEDRERLGGIEYRSLKLLLKIVIGYFFGLHLFGAISLVGWILHADSKYRDYLAECGQGSVWW